MYNGIKYKNTLFVLIFSVVILLLSGCIDKNAQKDANLIREKIQQINEENSPTDYDKLKAVATQYSQTNKFITAKLTKKGKVQTDNKKFYQYIPIKMQITNVTDKELDYVRSKVIFKDKNNYMIGYTSIETKDKIQPGKSIEWSGQYIMAQPKEHQTFINTDPDNILADTNVFSYKYTNEDLKEVLVW